jgi:predicted nucleotidyltransferase component of viral defense system
MINFDDIINSYPINLQSFKRNIFREYLQYKILAVIFTSNYGSKLSFLGGTALRIIHNNNRFSED